MGTTGEALPSSSSAQRDLRNRLSSGSHRVPCRPGALAVSVLPKILVPARYREDPRYAEEFAIPVILAVSLRLALLLLIPSLIAIGFVQWESSRRADSQLLLIERLETTEKRLKDERGKTIDAFARSDKLLCRGFNEERRIIADLIRSVIAARETAENRRQATLFFADALVKLEPRDCNKLPSPG